ncbi:hypothetical protein PybrP1_004647 [[Pythium] brassicae (nom. inval.)]|nr:hypothetical protein PybrP1_004647 [[Pythium] brassicae (nom. inval.)]
MAAVQVDRAQSDAMNLQVLKRQDSDVMEIVDTASHVVMYEFDQDNQSWKRKEVEGCLFVVKRFSTPRFQVFVNNRLSTTNMTLAVDEHLQVSSVDSFLIMRCPDAAHASGYAIYGLWFFPEEDREKILKLLTRVVQSVKEPQAAAANGSDAQQPRAAQPQQQQQHQPKAVDPQPAPPQQQQQTPQPQQPRARSRSRSKRDDANGRRQSGPGAGTGAAATIAPPTILQRSPSNGSKATPLLPPSAQQPQAQVVGKQLPLQEQPQQSQGPAPGSGMLPISREDGIAAGVAILGMISHNSTASQPQPQLQTSPSPRGGRGRNQRKKPPQQANEPALLLPTTVSAPQAVAVGGATVSKEQLKQALLSLLDDPHGANPFKRFAFGGAAAAPAPAAPPEPKRVKRGDAAAAVKREPSLSASRGTGGEPAPPPTALCVKAEPRDARVVLLDRLLRAREAMTTPIDQFGTQACVAPRAASAANQRFHVLVAALLSSQTKDQVTHAAMQRLHRELKTPPSCSGVASDDDDDDAEGVTVAKVRAADEDALDALLRPVGFHRRKAQQLKQVAEALHRQHQGDVPQSYDELVTLPGVGPKIARVILLLAWRRIDGLVVDTHVHRVANRLGWTTTPTSRIEGFTKTPEATRRALEEWVPRAHWCGFSRAVVGFGQRVCVAVNP